MILLTVLIGTYLAMGVSIVCLSSYELLEFDYKMWYCAYWVVVLLWPVVALIYIFKESEPDD